MAMYQYHLNSFSKVAEHYDSIKPIRGTDIRPLGDRARKWEHIVKVHNNKYVLTNILPDDEPNWIYQETRKGMIDRAPITWTRNPRTGIEKIRIRNGSGEYAHNSTYSFLYRALPYSMDFVVDKGKQFVQAYNMERIFQTHYLPKSRWVHERYYDHWNNGKQDFTKTDDKVYLEFEHTEYNCPTTGNAGTIFNLVHGQHKEPVTRYRIDKQAKKKYGQACKDLVEWAWTMKDLLVDSYQNDWQARQRIKEQCGDALNSHDAFRDMLLDDNDERRTPTVSWILGQISIYDYYQTMRTSVTDDPQKFRRQFNNQVNELAGFKTKHREFIEKDRSV
jgi:hypothetical protein